MEPKHINIFPTHRLHEKSVHHTGAKPAPKKTPSGGIVNWRGDDHKHGEIMAKKVKFAKALSRKKDYHL